MRFSWTGLILAPLLVPVLFGLVVSSLMGEGDLALSFLLPFIPACIVSYATTIFLFLPCLFLLSLWRPVTGLSVCVLGLVLGAAVDVPLTLMASYFSYDGPDDIPPTENFLTSFVRWTADPTTAIFVLAGLITAGLYWWLGTRRARSQHPAPRA